jgi:hypothetical protein
MADRDVYELRELKYLYGFGRVTPGVLEIFHLSSSLLSYVVDRSITING